LRLGRGLSKDEVDRFAKEDPKVKGHLEVIRRKELLELVLEKMDVEERGKRKMKVGKGELKKGGWSLF